MWGKGVDVVTSGMSPSSSPCSPSFLCSHGIHSLQLGRGETAFLRTAGPRKGPGQPSSSGFPRPHCDSLLWPLLQTLPPSQGAVVHPRASSSFLLLQCLFMLSFFKAGSDANTCTKPFQIPTQEELCFLSSYSVTPFPGSQMVTYFVCFFL